MIKTIYILFFLSLFQPTFATTFTVSNLNDAGGGSLRQAITDANADGSATAGFPHIINFPLTGTVNIITALPAITNHMTINGSLSGNTITALGNYRIFIISGAVIVSINNLIIDGGNPSGSNAGGGILNSGSTLSLNNCVIKNNTTGASPGANGGGISQSSGSLNITNSTFKNNDGGTFGRGGAINIDIGTASLTNCTLYSNQCGQNAGGIYAAGTSALTLINCTVVNNTTTYTDASLASGGIFYQSGALNMTNTILANNTSTGIANSDLNTFAATYTGTNANNIVENCNGFSAGFCSSVTFTSTADPNLATVTTCGLQDAFRPNTGSAAIDAGTATGAPAEDICGNTWIGSVDIGSVESLLAGTALDFDGSNDYVNIGTPFTGYTNEISVEAWINVATVTVGAGLGQATANVDNIATNVWFLGLNADNTISFNINDAGTMRIAKSFTTFNGGTGWHHVVGVASSTETAIYVDGAKQATAAGITTNIQTNAGASLHLGKGVSFATGQFLDGQLDEVRIWSEALCSTKITSRKDCELVNDETNLVHYYNFNQGASEGANPSEISLIDRQTNLTPQNGTLTDFALSGSSSNWADGSSNGVTGTCSSSFAEIDFLGNSISIASGNTPSPADHSDFGSTDIAASSVVRTFTIDNTTGSGPLTISNLFNTNTSDFTVAGITIPTVISAGSFITFTVTFDPTTVGLKAGTLAIFNDDCNENLYQVNIQGTGTNALPIELTNFKAKRKNKNEVVLDWSTASEQINQGFEIELMQDDQTDFRNVGWVNGQGTTSTKSDYQFIDQNNYHGSSLYRLKQIDLDGTFSYSNVVAVEGKRNSSEEINVTLFPNPANEFLHISLEDNYKTILSISDLTGKVIKQIDLDNITNQSIDISYLKNGIYSFRFINEIGKTKNIKINIVH